MATVKKQEGEVKDKFEDKLKALESRFGKGAIIHGRDTKEKLEVVPSGSLGIDIASSCNGLPIGKLIEFLGLESSGKSTLALHAIANFQKLGKCVLVDYEQSFDRTYAEALNIDMDKLVIIQAECLEDGYNITEELIKTGEVRLVVKDSHTAGMPRKVVDGETGDQSVGLQARINSQGLGKLKPLLKAHRCTVIGISQIRQNIGGYGDPNQSTGGLSWKFYSDMRFKFSKSVDKEGEVNKTKVEIIKNKCGCPYGIATFNINWGKGVDREQEIVDAAVEFKLLTKGGAGWYTIGETKLQGDDKLKQFMKDNPEYMETLTGQVMDKLKGEPIEETLEVKQK